ncbi:hypothetical protein PTSG_13107 [Salpingoeca rosetta]|uniref:Uncharacterized protein n=1 Tax=Salpingoeca rosetta (strain ATCC 50818 / BSB-021) TaxID=946362 RepID=F2URI4_SALR5|nr:uncharacterized protein PTSG_13107 [Salpingoeca rosetta]EGD80153.1 hypothetical protein PTSG_13107 [Salpingoeca rosetta]|eukprot:XP_004988215.1 hypothetical protein PTSG_13107 [Salpingoeca rosetta]
MCSFLSGLARRSLRTHCMCIRLKWLFCCLRSLLLSSLARYFPVPMLFPCLSSLLLVLLLVVQLHYNCSVVFHVPVLALVVSKHSDKHHFRNEGNCMCLCVHV